MVQVALLFTTEPEEELDGNCSDCQCNQSGVISHRNKIKYVFYALTYSKYSGAIEGLVH